MEYLQFLEIGGFYLFYRDLRIPRHIHSGKKDIWVGEIVEDSDYITGITGSTEMYGFQQIIALSHTSLDNIFASYYKEREWMQFSTWGGVEIKFGVPRVRLLSNNRALVFIHLESGVLQMTSESVRLYILSMGLLIRNLQEGQTYFRELDARLRGHDRHAESGSQEPSRNQGV